MSAICCGDPTGQVTCDCEVRAESHAELAAALERATRFINWIENNFCASGKAGEPYHQVHRDIVRIIHGMPRRLLPQVNEALDNARKLTT